MSQENGFICTVTRVGHQIVRPQLYETRVVTDREIDAEHVRIEPIDRPEIQSHFKIQPFRLNIY